MNANDEIKPKPIGWLPELFCGPAFVALEIVLPVATLLPLTELKERSHINARAEAANESEDFSRLIRVGILGIDE